MDIAIQILLLFIEHSGEIPFSLEIKATVENGVTSLGVDLTALDSFLFQPGFCQRVEYFKVRVHPFSHHGLPASWYGHLNSGSFANLKELHISHQLGGGARRPEHRQKHVSLANIPNLHRLLLHNFFHRCSMPSSVTALQLHGVAIETCVDLLLECPRISVFQCRSPRVNAPGDIGYPFPEGAIVLENLHFLEWGFNFEDSDWFNTFYQCVRAPNLTRLRLTGYSDVWQLPPALLEFLSSSAHLRHLTLENLRNSETHDICDIFSRVPQISDLIVKDRVNGTYSCYREVLQALEPSKGMQDVSSKAPVPSYLPTLRTLTLTHTREDKSNILGNLQFNILDMVEARAPIEDCVKLNITLNNFCSDFKWEDYHRVKFEEFSRKNRLEILINPTDVM
ncbi:hypothetical protein NP233_g7662 [Leucocoprinus birnbaumii]|uniref:F-box protein n=1 Tax=Leucocoprinus birnbaumii TaxID=56174 RepID=A0AAD5YUI9_9AGAR|nr:hypothetical protein NP233_g7662 [Leucocoprinus birnbaumii]